MLLLFGEKGYARLVLDEPFCTVTLPALRSYAIDKIHLR